MPRHEEQATLAYGAGKLFEVVADVKMSHWAPLANVMDKAC
jgi:ribosome-associated toxin RatA of RatAB toxin-antitoxin module